MNKFFNFCFFGLLVFLLNGCVTSPVMINKMEIREQEKKLDRNVLVSFDKNFLSFKHHEKQLGTTFEYDLGFYLKNAIHDSLSSIFRIVAQSNTDGISDKFDLVIRPNLKSFTAPVPALVLMSTKTKIKIQYEVTPNSPLKPFTITATGTYELMDEEDQKIYNSLTSGSIYTYSASTNFGMAVPDYSYEAGKDAYMAIYHSLTDLNNQLMVRLQGS